MRQDAAEGASLVGPGVSEQHRLQCEARYWLTFPLDERRAHLAVIKKIRGDAALAELQAEMKRQWEQGQKQLAP
jgi:hypothetical protein